MSCLDNGCDHINKWYELTPCPCLVCGTELAYCGWCTKCLSQWPSEDKIKLISEAILKVYSWGFDSDDEWWTKALRIAKSVQNIT